MHQQFYNLLVRFFPLFDFLPKFGKPKVEKAEKLIIYISIYYIIRVYTTNAGGGNRVNSGGHYIARGLRVSLLEHSINVDNRNKSEQWNILGASSELILRPVNYIKAAFLRT